MPQDFMPQLSIIVLNWNGLGFLDSCLESVGRQTRVDAIELIVVDNGSTDGSAELVSESFPDARLLKLDHNTGFCHGNNVGMAEASGDLILLLNNDAELAPDFVERLLEGASEYPEHGMFAAKVQQYDRREFFDSTGLLVYPDGVCRSRGWLEKDLGQYDAVEEVLGPNGCAAVYRRAMLDDVGGFDESYFAYLEDLDLAMRGQLRGWRCLYLPSLNALHKKSMTSGNHSAFKAYHVERNRIWNAFRLLPLRLLVLSPFYTAIRYVAQGCATATGKGISGQFRRDYSRGALAWILLRAYVAAFRRLPQVWKDRREIQKRRKVGVVEVYRIMRRYRLPLSELAFKD